MQGSATSFRPPSAPAPAEKRGKKRGRAAREPACTDHKHTRFTSRVTPNARFQLCGGAAACPPTCSCAAPRQSGGWVPPPQGYQTTPRCKPPQHEHARVCVKLQRIGGRHLPLLLCGNTDGDDAPDACDAPADDDVSFCRLWWAMSWRGAGHDGRGEMMGGVR